MSEGKPSSTIQVKFIKKPKILKAVNIPGFDPVEKKPSNNTPLKPKNEIVFDDTFFEATPEEILPIPAFDDHIESLVHDEQPIESKQDREDVDHEDDLLTEEIERLHIRSTNQEKQQKEKNNTLSHIFENTTRVNFEERIPAQHIKPNVIKSLVDNYNPPIEETSKPSTNSPYDKNNVSNPLNSTVGFEEAAGNYAYEDADIDIDGWLKIAVNYAEQQEYQQALQYFDRILFIQPTNYICHEYKAQVYLELGMFLSAIKAIESSIQCNPSWYVSHLTRARCQREMGELELSFQSYQHCHHLYRELYSDRTVENDSFLHDLNKEIEDVRVLLQDLQQKQQFYYDQMQSSITEDKEEVNRCFFHLSQRARSRRQLETIQKESSSNLGNAQTN
eukprot:gene9892-10746_t